MTVTILAGDCRDRLKELPDESVQCVVTSPPYYGLRTYGTPPVDWPAVSYSPMPGLPPIEVEPWTGDLGLEPTPEMYIGHMVLIFRAVGRVLREDGVVWLNIGDSYANSGAPGAQNLDKLGKRYRGGGIKHSSEDMPRPTKMLPASLKPKDLIGIPWRLAFALQADGWWLRHDVIWHKPNPMPESVTDRPTKAHEYVFLLSKAERYFYDHEAIKEHSDRGGEIVPLGKKSLSRGQAAGAGVKPSGNGKAAFVVSPPTRNKRSVWTIATKPFSEAHFAVMPPDLVEPFILAGTSEHGCCPECGAPWERVVEKVGERATHGVNGVADAARGRHGSTSVMYTGLVAVKETTGWRPTCTHDAAPIPCTVLDPFGGAGTVGLVADRLARDAILVELNDDYAEMARRRITGDAPLFASVMVT